VHVLGQNLGKIILAVFLDIADNKWDLIGPVPPGQ
jgi:hypothetical protein